MPERPLIDPNMTKYDTFIRILDKLRNEAPTENKRYYPQESEVEKTIQARSLAFIHLYLKVKFGLLEFNERESFITEGSYDGGIDAYFLDTENKVAYFIQSKFRANGTNFEKKEIALRELLKMDVVRILKGHDKDEEGNTYNSKIQELTQRIQSISDFALYDKKIIILANLQDALRDNIKKVLDLPFEIINYERSYSELVFPVTSGTYYNASKLKITLSVNANTRSNSIKYAVDTSVKECEITILFVPTLEIAKILHKYKNSILKFNPRSYLELKSGSVNERIKGSITEKKTNEFALFNNGITMLSDKATYSDTTGRKNEAVLIVENPQIINGGQTAYTLSTVYEDLLLSGRSTDIFSSKEVMLKVITFDDDTSVDVNEGEKLAFIEAISKATNDQTAVTEADRRSNDKIQVELQSNIYKEFGYFYERKRGEYGDGLHNKYIDHSQIINRETFLRICLSINGDPAQARQRAEDRLFAKDFFSASLVDASLYRKYFFGYKVYQFLDNRAASFKNEVNNRYGIAQYGQGLRYGKLAMAGVIVRKHFKNSILNEKFEHLSVTASEEILNKWQTFEEHVKQLPTNKAYFRKSTDPITGKEEIEVNFANYYKGKTVSEDKQLFLFRNRHCCSLNCPSTYIK